jgi:hypothetical protein
MIREEDIMYDKECFDCWRKYSRNYLNMHQCKVCEKWFCDDCFNLRRKTCFTCEIKKQENNQTRQSKTF